MLFCCPWFCHIILKIPLDNKYGKCKICSNEEISKEYNICGVYCIIDKL